MARPCKLDPESQARIIQAVSAGALLRDAAAAGGVSYRSLASWLARGRKATNGPFRQFFQALKAAEAEVAARMCAAIVAAAKDDWRASAFWLERRRPKEFGRRTYTEVGGSRGQPIPLAIHTIEVIPPQAPAVYAPRGPTPHLTDVG